MSWEAQNWASEQIAPDAKTKSILLALANCADPHGYAFPSVAYLAKVLQLSERTVQRGLKVLVEQCLIRREERFNREGRRTTDAFWLLGDIKPGGRKGAKLRGDTLSPLATPRGDRVSPPRGRPVTPPVTQPCHPPGDNCVTPNDGPVSETSSNPRARANGHAPVTAGGPEASEGGAAAATRFWAEHRAAVRGKVGESAYRSWIKVLSPVDLSASTLKLAAPSSFQAEGVRNRHADAIESAIGRRVEIVVEGR